MAKGRRMPMGISGGGMGGMFQRIQQLQEELARVQEELKDETVTATAGGGAVTVVVTGHLEVKEVRIDPEAVDPEDLEFLQDMIVAAVNEGIRKAQALAAERMGSLTQGLGLPPGLL